VSVSTPTLPLADLTTYFGDGDWIESKDQSTEGIRLVQTGNVGIGRFLDRKDKARYISAETFERLRCTEVLPGDCLVSRLPDPVGRACIVPDVGERMVTAVDCTIVRFDTNRILPKYFIYYATSRKYGRAVDSLTTGATRSRISRKNLGLIPIEVPHLDEQRRIVAKLDEALSEIGELKRNAAKQSELADAMASSLMTELLRAS
jgi:type I restriction enzyme S subunit